MNLKELTVEEIKKRYPQIPDVIFEWNNYAVKNNIDLGCPGIKEIEITGWTYNNGLKVKPSEHGISIMFVYQDQEYWQHLTKYAYEMITNIYFDVELIENEDRIEDLERLKFISGANRNG
jgi:hypothetical protein